MLAVVPSVLVQPIFIKSFFLDASLKTENVHRYLIRLSNIQGLKREYTPGIFSCYIRYILCICDLKYVISMIPKIYF